MKLGGTLPMRYGLAVVIGVCCCGLGVASSHGPLEPGSIDCIRTHLAFAKAMNDRLLYRKVSIVIDIFCVVGIPLVLGIVVNYVLGIVVLVIIGTVIVLRRRFFGQEYREAGY